MEKSQPIVIIAENQSSVWSGSVELFNAQNVVGGGEYDKTGETEILTEKYKNQSTLPVQQDSKYGGNPYVQFDIGDDGATFETGKLVTIKVNGEDKKGIVKEYDDGNGNIIRGFGNPFLFNSTLYQDNGLDYFAFYEGGEEGQYISGTINNGASTFSFNLNESEVTVNVDANGNWKYVIPSGISITSLKQAFVNKSNLTSLDLSHIDTSACTNMMQMVDRCHYLTSINLDNFDTSACTNMQAMFYWNNRLTSIDLSSFDTRSVTTMNNMFYWCTELSSITFGENFITTNVTDMGYMFSDCSSLTSLDLSTFDTANVTNMEQMFRSFGGMSLDLSNFDTRKVTNMREMFYSCSYMRNLSVGTNFITSEVTDMSGMFQNYAYLDTGHFAFPEFALSFDTAKVTTMKDMFNNCCAGNFGVDKNFSGYNTENVTDMSGMFANVNNVLGWLNLQNWNTLGVTEFTNMFSSGASFEVYRTIGIWNEDITNAFPNIDWQTE